MSKVEWIIAGVVVLGLIGLVGNAIFQPIVCRLPPALRHRRPAQPPREHRTQVMTSMNPFRRRSSTAPTAMVGKVMELPVAPASVLAVGVTFPPDVAPTKTPREATAWHPAVGGGRPPTAATSTDRDPELVVTCHSAFPNPDYYAELLEAARVLRRENRRLRAIVAGQRLAADFIAATEHLEPDVAPPHGIERPIRLVKHDRVRHE